MKQIFAVWLGLTLLYAAVLMSVDPWDLVFGGLLSAGLLVGFRRFLTHMRPPSKFGISFRLLGFVPLALAVIKDISKGIWQVSLTVLHLRPLGQPGIVTVPIGERTPRGVAVTALLATLSPGSVFLDVDWERGLMLFHYIDAANAAQVRKDMDDFYQRYQQHVFP